MDIPGYYYDRDKRRYFKIENSRTAPANAAWSARNVKRQKLQDEDAAATQRHLQLCSSRIKRAKVLSDPLTGGFFAREYGAMKSDMQATCFVQGLKNKGTVPLLMGRGLEITDMYIGGQDRRTGLCAAYSVLSGKYRLSTYIARDKNDCLDGNILGAYNIPISAGVAPIHYEPNLSHITGIQYHEARNCMLMTGSQPHGPYASVVWRFSPKIDVNNNNPWSPYWLFTSEPSQNMEMARSEPHIVKYDAHCAMPAPVNSPLVFAISTSRGIVQWKDGLDQLQWLTPPTSATPSLHQPSENGLFRDIFAVDFLSSQSMVLQFGGRPGALFTADTRVPWRTWSHVKLPSSITHLRCLSGGNQVLAAGLRNQLGVYDLRFVRTFRGARDEGGRVDITSGFGSAGRRRNGAEEGRNGQDSLDEGITRPVISFKDYRNSAHIKIGFAYDATTGVVAAAHDVPGTIALYSVRTGSRLRVLNLASEGWAAAIPKVLKFETFPNDCTPTLFTSTTPAANPGGIAAFSFGVDKLGDEA
ncbi:hypothetical protein GGS21DRAFT_500477 [Xylaria nigripes]|nr:hypothetical protein GGS21DRAFT_500477 [Xylaria nigripes]